MKRAVEDGLALLAGAGVGMAVMYLMDPDMGRRRRARISRATADALEQSGEYLGAATGVIGSGASSLTGRIGDRFSHATDSLSDTAHSAGRMISREPAHWWERAGDSARRLLHRGSNRAEGWYDSGSSWLGSWGNAGRRRAEKAIRRAGSYVPHEEDHHYVGMTACALGSLALGAGLLYLFDPQQGRTRRAHLRDKTVRYTNETGDFFRKAGRHLSNHLRGTYYETKRYVSRGGGQADDRTLERRIRSSLGRVSSRLGGMNVQCMTGRVTLVGTAPADDIDAIVSAILNVSGVSSVDNQLRPQTIPEGASSSAFGSYNPAPTAM
jgi:hypothetical protein